VGVGGIGLVCGLGLQQALLLLLGQHPHNGGGDLLHLLLFLQAPDNGICQALKFSVGNVQLILPSNKSMP